MNIPLPQSEKPDIFSFGFAKNLNRDLQKIESPLVYNIIDDRMSLLIQNNNKISTSNTKIIYAKSNNTTG